MAVAVPVVHVNALSVEQVLMRAMFAVSPASSAAWLNSAMHPYLQRRASARFASEGDDASGKWEELKESTIEFRASFGFPPGPINRRTGELESYITGSPARTTVSGVASQMIYPGKAPTGWLHEKVRTAQMGKDDPATVARPVLALDPSTDVMYALTSLAGWIGTYIGGRAPRGAPRAPR